MCLCRADSVLCSSNSVYRQWGKIRGCIHSASIWFSTHQHPGKGEEIAPGNLKLQVIYCQGSFFILNQIWWKYLKTKRFCLGISFQDWWTLFLYVIALCVIQGLLFNFELWHLLFLFFFLLLGQKEGPNTTAKIFLTFVEWDHRPQSVFQGWIRSSLPPPGWETCSTAGRAQLNNAGGWGWGHKPRPCVPAQIKELRSAYLLQREWEGEVIFI